MSVFLSMPPADGFVGSSGSRSRRPGSGRVFDPNPVVSLRDQSLSDQDDADYPALAGAYREVALTRLDGSGFLRGDYASIALDDLDAAFSSTLEFRFDRSSPPFEQVMSYYQVTRAQEYVQSLGFTDINAEPQALLPDLLPFDNSFYDGFEDVIVFGTGGVDDAEDADVIWHEYGHAMQADQFMGPFPLSADAAAIGEGFGDYWAVTMSQPVNAGYEVPCVGDWNAISFTPVAPHCGRRVDEDLVVADRTGEPHDDGRIWSRALWDINQALGRDAANRIVLEAQFAYSPSTSFPEAAAVTTSTAKRLDGGRAAKVVEGAFARRGISLHPNRSLHPSPPLNADLVAAIGDPAPGGGLLAVDFELGGLNRDGIASFNADLDVDGELIGEGAFVSDGKRLSELARSGGAAPGGGTYGPGTIGPVALNDPGDVAFAFTLDPDGRPFGVNTGLYLRSALGGLPSPVVVPDDTPAPSGGAFRGAYEAALNRSRQVAFTGITDTDDGYLPGLGSGVYVAAPDGNVSIVAAPGSAAAGGGTLDFAGGPSINAAGDVAFSAHVATDPSFCLQGFIDCIGSLFVRRGSTMVTEPVARQGAPVPGIEGSSFVFAVEPLVNDRGDVAFLGKLDPSLDNGLFLRTAGTTQLVARDFQRIPDVGDVVVSFPIFRAWMPDYALNNRGQIAFLVGLFDPELGTFGPAVLSWDAGTIRLVARPGTSVPGVGTIENIYNSLLINDRGQILLQAQLVDGRRVLLRTR